MVKVLVEAEIDNILTKLDKWDEVKTKTMNNAAKSMLSQLVNRSPVDHGILNGWFIFSRSETEVNIRSPAIYTKWVNDGHRQQPGRFIPGEWRGNHFQYIPEHKTGMVLKARSVKGKHFVEDSITAVEGEMETHFKKAVYEVLQ